MAAEEKKRGMNRRSMLGTTAMAAVVSAAITQQVAPERIKDRAARLFGHG